MTPISHQRRKLSLTATLLLLCLSLSPGLCADEVPPASPAAAPDHLPKYKEMQLPSAEELLTQLPRDWIVLNNDDVLVVEPMVPSPRTLEQRQQEIGAKTDARGKVLGEKREQLDREIEVLNTFIVILSDGTNRLEFKLPVKLVKQIIHHEDLILRRLDILLTENKLDQAYELLTRLEQKRPDWEGASQAGLKLLAMDAQRRLQSGQPEAALTSLDELRRRDPKYAEIMPLMGEAVRQLTESALTDQNPLRAQYFLNYLQQRFPDHPVYREFSARMAQLAAEQMQLARQADQNRDQRAAALEAEKAIRIWPPAKELKAPYTQYSARYQLLHVGVTDLPGECVAYPLPSPADERRSQLTRLPLFEIDRVRDGTAYYRTRFFDEWEPQDLGRQMRFTLRQFRQLFEMQAVATAPQVVAPILKRLDPQSPQYDERLAAFIESVEVRSPTEFIVTFRRVPPRVEPMLADLFLLNPALDGDSIPDPGGFHVLSQTAEQCEYVRSLPEPDGLQSYHIAEVVEHRYDSPERVVQGLRRGEVSMTSGLPDVDLRTLQADAEFNRGFFIQPCLLPVTHLLQFNPASAPLRVSELRKGLAYAVDCERLLKDVVLQDPRARHGRVVTAPFNSKNPGRNSTIQPRRFDLSNAFALSVAARQKLKGKIPPLTMIVAPGTVATKAAQEIARSWRRLGLEINVVLADEPAPRQWDILYRTLEMSEPILEMWSLLTFSEKADIDGLKAYPDWIKQELVQLDRTGDQTRAIEALQVLHKHLWDDTAFVSLWEVDQFVVLRKNIQGFPEKFVHCYDHIDHWRQLPWYQESLP